MVTGKKRRRFLRSDDAIVPATTSTAAAPTASSSSTVSAAIATTSSSSTAAATTTATVAASASSSAAAAATAATIVPKDQKTHEMTDLKTPVANQNTQIFECNVCLHLVTNRILQCSEGHIFCNSCYSKLTSVKKAVCPTCRKRISRHTFIRNRALEALRNETMMMCSNAGCTIQLPFLQMDQHKNFKCNFRSACCMYHELGCTWMGTSSIKIEHEATCSVSLQTGKTILQALHANKLKAADAVIDPFAHMTLNEAADMKIAASMRNWCRDVFAFRCVMESGEGEFPVGKLNYNIRVGIKNSKFGAIIWQKATNNKRYAKRLTFDVSLATVDQHPENYPPIPPTFYESVPIRRGSKKGVFLHLPLTCEQGKLLENPTKSWKLLIVFVDKSSGYIVPSHQKLKETGQLSTDESSGEDTDFDDDEKDDADADANDDGDEDANE